MSPIIKETDFPELVEIYNNVIGNFRHKPQKNRA